MMDTKETVETTGPIRLKQVIVGRPSQEPVTFLPAEIKMDLAAMSFYYNKFRALNEINMQIPGKKITAIIGPSGCGKSTLLRSLNRMNDLIPRSRVEGEIRLDGTNIYSPGVDVVDVRRRVVWFFNGPIPSP
jgi:phosphate transport system ATP-binding protein